MGTAMTSVAKLAGGQLCTGPANAFHSPAYFAAEVADPSTLLVLEETAGSYGGGGCISRPLILNSNALPLPAGCENITDRFASGFCELHNR
jgi:hypothetical protein